MNELENKKQFKCIWVGPSLKEEKEIILYPNKNGTVATLLEEAKKQVELSENGSGKLRILEINCNKLLPGPGDDVPLDNLNSSGTKLYRIEEIPNDELHLAEGELLVPVAHFHKDVFSTFGIPFFFKIKNVSNLLNLNLILLFKSLHVYCIHITHAMRILMIVHVVIL